MEKYDLIIVGAGPAGIFTAVELLRRGSKKHILLVEKGKPVIKESPYSDEQGLSQMESISLRSMLMVSGLALSVLAARCHCPGCGSQSLLRCRLHPAGRCPNSSSLLPPLAAVVAVAPKGRAFTSGWSEK